MYLVISLEICILLINVIDSKELHNLNIFKESFEPNIEDVASVGGWTLTSRTDLWKVSSKELNSAQSRPIQISTEASRSGKSSLAIGPWTSSANHAFFASKYALIDGKSRASAPLVVKFWSRGKEASRVKIHVQVSYHDNSYLFVEVVPYIDPDVVDPDGAFIRTCVFVPNYGRIRAVMFHVVLDQDVDSVTYLDDISVEHTTVSFARMTSCQLYNASFPQRRHVLANFLTRSKTRQGRGGITLSTQLTKDRLKHLERIARVWKGPISAALLIFGPIGSRSELTDIVSRYYSSKALQKYVTIHIIWEDVTNGRDSNRYPINYLRNIALSENSGNKFVFFLDVDIMPGFTEREAYKWVLAEELSTESGSRRAFIAPTFNVEQKSSDKRMPRTKQELLDLLRTPDSGFDMLRVTSHSVVKYTTWKTSKRSYEVGYADDMEPYFITSSHAPLMSDIYAGYGRDKCAYSRDLHAAGYKFIVLPEAFVLNHLDSPPNFANTMYRRSNGLQLNVFLNIAFHNADIQAGFFHYPLHYSQDASSHSRNSRECETSEHQCQNENDRNLPSNVHRYQKEHQNILENDKAPISNDDQSSLPSILPDVIPIDPEEAVTNSLQATAVDQSEISNTKAVNTALKSLEESNSQTDNIQIKDQSAGIDKEPKTGQVQCVNEILSTSPEAGDVVDKCVESFSDWQNIPEITSLPRSRKSTRMDQIVEDLIEVYGVHSLIDLRYNGKEAHGSFITRNKFLLQLMQADSITSLMPDDVINETRIEGVFESFRSTQSSLNLLTDVVKTHPGPKLYMIDISDDSLSESDTMERIAACLAVTTRDDVILITSDDRGSKSTGFWRALHDDLCHRRTDWHMLRLIEAVIIKSTALREYMDRLYDVPTSPPSCFSRFEADESILHVRGAAAVQVSVTDVILITKNRPLQTYAFVESLIRHVTGIQQLWIIVKSEGDVFDKGYALVKECLASKASFSFNFVEESNGGHMGELIADILTSRSTAPFIMFAVDEMIWLRPVNLDLVAAILRECEKPDTPTSTHDVLSRDPHGSHENQSRDPHDSHVAKDDHQDTIVTVQLRLGENINIYNRLPHKDLRFRSVPGHPVLVAYYPRRLPYDFGYILNIDGVMARTRDIITDFKLGPGDAGDLGLCRKPMCIEQGWMMRALHIRTRQWQLMYRQTRVVNNMGLLKTEGGSVASRRDGDIAQGSQDIARVLVEEGNKIDVVAFADRYKSHGQVHTTYPVEYIPLQCT